MLEKLPTLVTEFLDWFVAGLADHYEGALFGAIASVIGAIFLRWIMLHKNTKELKRYCGSYVGYRTGPIAGKDKPHKPTMKITPHLAHGVIATLKAENHEAEITFKLKRLASDSYLKFTSEPNPIMKEYIGSLIVFTNKTPEVNVLYGVYCFTNTRNRPVAGNILFVKEHLVADPVVREITLEHVEIDIDTFGDLLEVPLYPKTKEETG